jgi:hypothetical protein
MPREGFVIRLEEWVDIVALHRQGFSIKAIARQLGISRNAVRRGLRREGPPVRAPQRLLELPSRRCVLALDSKTDIFRAKKILAGHMCLLGDVPPGLLTLGTVQAVNDYCWRLLDKVGPDGFIMAQGCAIPPSAKFENVQAMVDSVKLDSVPGRQ